MIYQDKECIWIEVGKRQFGLYKEKLRPLIASANLYHILARPDGYRWDGMQYFDPKTGKGVVYIFRPQNDMPMKTVSLRGLDQKKRYSITSEDGSVDNKVVSGKELMETGIAIHLPELNSSDLIFLSEVK